MKKTALIILLAANISFGQQPFIMWNFEARHQVLDSIVKVFNDNGGQGTGIIINVDTNKEVGNGYEGYCLTAFHVVENSTEVSIEYNNGKRAKQCTLKFFDKENDVAIVWVWVPKGIIPAVLSNNNIVPGDNLHIAGLGNNAPFNAIRFFPAQAENTTTSNQIFSNSYLLPGDSGGPVFNNNYEVVGVISGGLLWSEQLQPRFTWPGRFCNVHPIRNLYDQIKR